MKKVKILNCIDGNNLMALNEGDIGIDFEVKEILFRCEDGIVATYIPGFQVPPIIAQSAMDYGCKFLTNYDDIYYLLNIPDNPPGPSLDSAEDMAKTHLNAAEQIEEDEAGYPYDHPELDDMETKGEQLSAGEIVSKINKLSGKELIDYKDLVWFKKGEHFYPAGKIKKAYEGEVIICALGEEK